MSLKPVLYLVTEINEILVRGLTGESRVSVWRPAGIHTCSPAALTSVSEHKNRCSFVLLSCLSIAHTNSSSILPLSTIYYFTFRSLQSSQSVTVCNLQIFLILTYFLSGFFVSNQA